MTDQATINHPELQRVDHRVRKLPAEVTRWMLTLKRYPETPEMVSALNVVDDEFEVVILTKTAFNTISAAMNAPHRDRRRALYEDRNGDEHV